MRLWADPLYMKTLTNMKELLGNKFMGKETTIFNLENRAQDKYYTNNTTNGNLTIHRGRHIKHSKELTQ